MSCNSIRYTVKEGRGDENQALIEQVFAELSTKAPEGLRYLGLMGSRRKVARVRAELAALGYDFSGIRLHAPIGLPIGGDSPGEIAISILAEVIGTRYEKVAAD